MGALYDLHSKLSTHSFAQAPMQDLSSSDTSPLLISLDHRPSWFPSLQGCWSYSALPEVLPLCKPLRVRRWLFFLIHRERPDTVGDDDSGESLVDENEPIQPLQQLKLEDYTDPNWELDPIDAGPCKVFFFVVRKRSLMDRDMCLFPARQ